jgi:hypothetical protein
MILIIIKSINIKNFCRAPTTTPLTKVKVKDFLKEKEGYDYPKPRIPFPPATERTIVKQDPVPDTYLPPAAPITTTTR